MVALTARSSLGVLLTSLLFLGGCAEPFIVMAGGELAGEETDPPADWDEFADEDIVQLETRPDDPYSINIWMIADGADVYVATGDGPTRWTRHIENNPDVRLRIQDRVYALEAYRVLDPTEKLRIGQQYVSKYDVDDDNNWVEEGQLFRLDRR
ncbi:MAG: hypothetical protein AAGE43_03680 [Pseudomonadota bacterium]